MCHPLNLSGPRCPRCCCSCSPSSPRPRRGTTPACRCGGCPGNPGLRVRRILNTAPNIFKYLCMSAPIYFLQCPLVARRLQDLAAAMRGVRGAGDLHVRLGVPQDGGPGEDQSEHGIWSRDRSAHLLLASTWACAWTASCSGAAACTTPRTTSSRTRATPPAR